MKRLFAIFKKEKRHLCEWLAVLQEEGREARWWPMLRALLTGRVDRAAWRRRMKTGCLKCPIYDRELRRCRGPRINGTALGCGCYVVFAAVTRRPYAAGCWGRTAIGGDFGWGTNT